MAIVDKIDKKLLIALTENCRYSNSLLAKQLGVSEQFVKYRIERLEAEGIISKYITAVMRNAIGTLRYYALYIKIKKTRPKEKQAILNFLVKNPYAISVIECEGLWDISVEVTAAVLSEVKSLLDEVQRLGGIYIEDLKVLNISLSRFLKRRTFPDIKENLIIQPSRLHKDTSFQKELISAKKKIFYGLARLEDIDIKILGIMRHQPRLSLHQIAKDSGYNIQTIKVHITNMINRGIIKHFTTQIDYSKLGMHRCIILFSVLTDEIKREEIINYVEQKFPAIHSVVGYFDYWNLGFRLYFNNLKEADLIIEDIVLTFQGIISDYNKLILVTQLKDESYSIISGEMYHTSIKYLEPK